MAVVFRPKATPRTHLTVLTPAGEQDVTAEELVRLVQSGTYISCPVCQDEIAWCPTAIAFVPALASERNRP